MKKFLLIIVFGWLGLSALADELKGNDYDDQDEYSEYQDVVRGRGGDYSGRRRNDDYNELYYQAPRDDTHTLNYRGRSSRTGRYVHRGR